MDNIRVLLFYYNNSLYFLFIIIVTILQNYALDGALNFGRSQVLLMLGILASKNVWRNRGLFI